MLKVKDGYAKVIGTTVNGSSDYLLLSNGGQKAVSDFAIKGHTHNYLPLSGGTETGVVHSNYKSGTWVNSLTNSAITLNDANGSYGGWICGPTKDGRIAISTFQASNNNLYFGYGERNRTTNSFAKEMYWEGDTNILHAGTFIGYLDWSYITNKPTTLSGYGIIDGINTVTTSGSGNAFTAASISGHTLTLTKGATYLTSHQDLSAYATQSWVNSNFSASGHTHGLLHYDLAGVLANTTTDSGWAMINSTYNGYILKALRMQSNAPAWLMNNYAAGIVFGGADTKGVLSVAYNSASAGFKIAGGNGSKPVWWMNIHGTSGKCYNLDAFKTEIPTALKNPYSFTVFGVSYDGSSAKIVDKTTFVSTLDEGTSTITDGTMLITSQASNNGFADSGGVNVPYKRKAIHLWEYISSKTNSLYVTSLGTSNINLTWTKNGSTGQITIPGIADNGPHAETASGTTANATNAGMLFGSGMYMTRTYGDTSAMPCSYGNVLNMAGGGSSQLLLGWSSSDSATAYIYYRSHRDTTSGGWGAWRRLFYADELPSSMKNPNAIKFKDINGNTVSYDGSSACDLTTGTYIAKLPYGFSSWASGCTWGNTTGTSFASWNDSTGGSIDFRRDNPSSGKMSIKVDGRVYVNEGNNPVLSSESNNGFWGMRTPDGGNDWIRTSNNGLIPYVSGGAGSGHSSLGTSSWYFSTAYIDKVYGSLQGNATYAYHLHINSADTWSNWYWSGQSGQPTWLWGSNDGTNMYVWNPSNFSVAEAKKTINTVTGTNAVELVRGNMADNDQFRILVGGTASNAGYAEIATADDGTEPIYVRQYTGVFSTIKRTLTLLDGNGYSYFPSYINIGGNEGNNSSPNRVWGSNGSDTFLRSYLTSALSVNYATSAGNSATATKLQTSRTIWGQSFDGTNNISGSMTGVGNINTSSSPAGTIYTNNWYRSIGTTGWYSETYGGGWYMNDSSWVKVWNNKGIYTDNEIKARMFRATTNNGAYLFGSSNAKISYSNNLLIFNTGDAIRFGATSWDYDQWAGLKYVSSSKTIYLGLADGTIFTKNATAQTGGILNLVNINTLTTPASLMLSGATKITSSAGLEIQGTITGADYATSEGYYTNAHNSIILRGDTTYGKSGILFTSSKGTTSINQTSDKGFIQFQSYGGTNTSGENNILLIGVGNDSTDRVYLQTPSVTGLKHAIGTSVYTIPTNGDDNTEGLLFRHDNYQYTKTIGYPTATSQTTTAYSDYYVLRMRTYSTWDSTNSKSVNGGYEYTISNTVPNANAVGNYPANKLAKAYNNGNISLNDVAKSYGSFFGMTMSREGTNYPNNSTSWFHIFQSSYNNQSGGSDSTTNYWITQIVNRAGSTTPYIRSRGGGNDISTNWTDWKRILTESDYPTLVIVNSNSSVATDKYANLTNGYVHLNLINPVTSKVISSGCIKGSGATTVTTDASGNIIVNSTNTQRGITDSYSGTSTTISLSQKGANDLYSTLTKAIPTSLKNPNALSWSGYSNGSYDGSAAKSISIPNNTNQLTNGAGYITSSGSCSSANRLAVNKEFAKGNNFLQYFNASSLSADTIGNAAPSTDWWHIIRMNHGNSSGYFSELAIALNQDTGVYWRTIRAGAVTKSWTRLANADEVLRYYDTLYSSSTPSNATPNATKNASNLTLPTTTVWNKLGIRQFNGTFPDNLSGSIYNYGAVISLPGNTSRFDLYYSHQSSYNKSTYTDNGLYYRTGWGDGASAASTYKYPWAKIIDSNNIGSQTVAKAGALDITNDVGSYNTPVYFTGGKPKECQASIAKMFKVSGSNSLATVTDYLDNRTWSNQISVKTTSTDDGYLMNGIKYYFELDTELDTANNTTFVAFVSNSEDPTSGVAYYYAINPRVQIVESARNVIARVDFALYDKSTNFTVNLIVYKVTTK